LDRKFIVFVSSTFNDLKNHRQSVIESIVRLKHIPIAMEYFPAKDKTLQYIEQQIEASDMFLIIVGGNIGDPVLPPDPTTFTQYEYQFALKYQKEIIILLQESDEFRAHQHAPGVAEFRDRLMRAGGSVGFFFENQPDRTGNTAMHALIEAVTSMERRPQPGGWMRADAYDRIKQSLTLGAKESQSPFLQRYVSFFETLRTINDRALSSQNPKIAIGKYLWKYFITAFGREKVHRIFFESGSSTAYASYYLLGYIREHLDWFRKSKMSEELTIITNNLFTLLDFTLYSGSPRLIQDIVLYPKGPFWEKYAATYGSLVEVGEENPGLFRDPHWKLSDEAIEACRMITSGITELLSPKGLIVMAVSGIEWTEPSIRGPHVGSYHNGLMKRGLISSRHAKIIMLDDTKWNKPFDFQRCFPVCGGDDVDWHEVMTKSPVAFAIGSDNRDASSQIESDVVDHGFDFVTEVVDGCFCTIAYNNSFKDWRASS
jgi:hypothetical protein